MAAFLALQGVWGVLLAQEPPAGRLEVRSWQKRVVQGEILWLEGKLTWSQAVDLPGKLQGMDPNLWIEWTLPGGATRLEATGREPEVSWRGPAYRPERGCPEVVQISLWPCEPGTHRIRLRYRVSPEWQKRGSFWEGEVLSDWAEVEVTAPQGADAEVWKAYLALSPQMDCQRFYTWATYPSNGILTKFPTSTYAGYVLARKLLDFSDWRFKVGTPASAIQAGKEHPEWATRSQSDVELFNLVEKHIQGGNVPESLRAVLYGYYGEQLILRGRAAEAEAAFCQAVKEKPGDAKGEAYFTRAQQFLEALRKHGE